MASTKIITIAILSSLLTSCNTEIKDLPVNVKEAIERHSELVDLSEVYSFSLNQHDPDIFHDSVYSYVHDQINSALIASKADEIWIDYEVQITEDGGGIIDISNYSNYDLGRHKNINKKQWGMPTTTNDKNIYPSFHENNNSKLLPIRRSTVVNYKTMSDTHRDLDKAKVVECHSISKLKINGLIYNLSVSTSEVIQL